jgi:pimeloyl-ACP methyl ester carboxylesterase
MSTGFRAGSLASTFEAVENLPMPFLSVLDHLKIARCAVLGTSRGGIVGMLMANMAPTRIAGLMLNDIGAELDSDGLLRIIEHVGKPARFRDWDDAAIKFSKSAVGFEGVTHKMWRGVVRRIYQYANGAFVHRHDLRLADSLPSKEDIRAGKVANLWSLVPSLIDLPCSLLRGSGSDLLSRQTVGKMRAALPALDFTEIPGRGHVPFLDEVESVAAISRWLDAVDLKEKGQPKLTL